jgi:Big-like domain-containing protein
MRRVVAALVLLTACGGGGDLLLPGSGVPATITLVSGGQQSGRVGEAIPDSIVVSVADGEGRPVQGTTVVFAFVDASPGAALDPDTATTNGVGLAWAHAVLGTRVGAQQGQAQALTPDGTDPPTTTFTLTALPENANGITDVSGNDQSGQVGSTLPAPLVVAVTDGFGNPIEGVAIDWTVDGGGQVSETSTTTGADGQTAVMRTLGTTAGTQHTFASAAGLAGSPVTFTHSATSGSAAQVSVVSGNNQIGAIGTTLPDSLIVAVADGQGNPVPGTAVAWVVGAGGGTLSPSNGTTDASGRAGAAWTLGPQPAQNTANAVVSGIGIAGFTATATAGAPARLAIRIQPSATATSGVPFAQQPTVQLVDAQGNDAHTAGIELTAAIGSGAGTLRGTKSPRTDANGLATFTDLAIEGSPGPHTLRFSASGFAAVTSNTIDLAGVATTTRITSHSPDPSGAGQAVTVTFTVSAASGTPGGSVTVTDGQASCTGSLGGGAGRCTLTLLTVGTRTLTASYPGQNSFASSSGTASHEVQPAGPPVLVLSRQPSSSATSGIVFGRQPEVQLRDPFGGDLHTAGVAVFVSASGGTLQGTASATTDANGRAAFTNLAISGQAGSYTLGFSAAGFTGVTSDPIDLAHAVPSASNSTVVADPTSISAGSGSSTIAVTVRDASNTPISGIQVTLDASGSENTITPVTPGTGADGVATFTFSSTAAEVKTITARADGTPVGQVSITVEIVPTQTSILSDTPDPSAEGDVVDVSFSVTSADGTPTGEVTVQSDQDNDHCSATVEAGHCGIRLKKSGTNILTATYAGNKRFAESSGTASHEVHGR